VTELAKIYAGGDTMGFKGRQPLYGCSVTLLPLCNPDGVRIALSGSPLWKANARGVDLNVNFDADWGKGKKNVFHAGPENYIGESPESEPETKALADFTRRIKPKAVAAFHSKGEVVYYRYRSCATLAKKVARATGYKAIKTRGSVGGYCDWAADLGIQAITIEVGNDKLAHPIEEKELARILKQTIVVPTLLSRSQICRLRRKSF
jgi:g-D-glutamyl-meso-diaminopimelate peptidase